jgi:hypothetical protein
VESIGEADLQDEDVIVLDRSLWDLEERYRRIAEGADIPSTLGPVAPDGATRERSERRSRRSASAGTTR